MTIDRPVPFNLEAERAVLGSILMDRDAILAVVNWLKPVHFYLDRHAWLYEAMVACYARRVPPDLVNIGEECRRMKRLDQPGDTSYLVGLVESVPTAYHIEYYARIVEAAGVRRALLDTADKIGRLACDESTDLDTIAADAQALLAESTKRLNDSSVQAIEESALRVIVKVRDGVKSGIPTGIAGLDEKLGGIHPGRLHVFAGPPGSGKTSLARQILYNIASHGGRGLFFSLEMSSDEATEWLASLHSGVPARAISEGRLEGAELDKVIAAAAHIAGLPIHIDDTGGTTAAEIRLKTLRYAAEFGPPAVIVVDYLQLMAAPRRSKDNPGLDIDANARAMKLVAKEVQAPLILLSQMTKEGQKRGDKPKLFDLLYGGDKDADSVAIAWREAQEDDKPEPETVLVEWHLVKHRQGPTGVVPLQFRGATTKFFDIDRYRAIPGY